MCSSPHMSLSIQRNQCSKHSLISWNLYLFALQIFSTYKKCKAEERAIRQLCLCLWVCVNKIQQRLNAECFNDGNKMLTPDCRNAVISFINAQTSLCILSFLSYSPSVCVAFMLPVGGANSPMLASVHQLLSIHLFGHCSHYHRCHRWHPIFSKLDVKMLKGDNLEKRKFFTKGWEQTFIKHFTLIPTSKLESNL